MKISQNKIIIFHYILVLLGFLLLVSAIFCILGPNIKYISNEIIYIENTEKSCKLIKFPPYTLYGYGTYFIYVRTTAYSSTIDQTDSTPFITASGTTVRDGVVACNFLKFGTKIRFPEIYGHKIFIVEDRMADNAMIDIWFPDRQSALNFGKQVLLVQILN